MAELLRGRAALTIDWLVSLGLDMLETNTLLTAVHDFEGLGVWLHEASSALPVQLRHDLDLALRPSGYPQAVIETIAAEVLGDNALGHASAEALFADIAALSPAACKRMVEQIIAKSISRRELDEPRPAAELLADPEALENVLLRLHTPVDPTEAARVLGAPAEWRNLLLQSLQRVWERVYREQWEHTRERLVRSVDYARRQSYGGDLAAIFTGVTGRQIPDRVRPRLLEVERVRFVPSLYLGPYVSVIFDGEMATVFYNGEGTPLADNGRPQVDELYHPLTALADKTRLSILAMLDGRELYAQEIVDRLGISQSAVSRHLQLMVDMKVLNVRRGERGAKYYSVSVAVLQRVAQRLSEFK